MVGLQLVHARTLGLTKPPCLTNPGFVLGLAAGTVAGRANPRLSRADG